MIWSYWFGLFWNERGEAGASGGEGAAAGATSDTSAEGGEGGGTPKETPAITPEVADDIAKKAAVAAVAAIKEEAAAEEATEGGGAGEATGGAVSEFMQPAIKPVKETAERAELVAQGAADASVFYAGNAAAVHFKPAIEKKFSELMKAGQPASRSNILQFLAGPGGELEEPYRQYKAKVQADSEREAAFATTAGPGASAGTRGGVQAKAAADMTDEELDGVVAQPGATF